MASKRESPSDTPGGGGGGGNERGGSLWGTFSECLFFNAFSDALFEALDPILEVLASILTTLECFFAVFSYIRGFLKIALPCRRELKNQGPGVTEIAQKSNNKCIWLWDCFGEPVFKEIVQSGLKNAPKGTPNWTPKLAWCAGRTSYFQPLVDKFVQVVPNGAQSDSKGVQRVPK